MTVRKHSDYTFAAGFDLALRFRDAAFRDFLSRNGWTSGTHIVVTVDDEPVIDVIHRVAVHRDDQERAFIAIVDDDEEFGCRLLVAELVTEPTNATRIVLADGASIGMLYSALGTCGTYVPSRWTHEILFERVPAAA